MTLNAYSIIPGPGIDLLLHGTEPGRGRDTILRRKKYLTSKKKMLMFPLELHVGSCK